MPLALTGPVLSTVAAGLVLPLVFLVAVAAFAGWVFELIESQAGER
jgi:hypothetical protein